MRRGLACLLATLGLGCGLMYQDQVRPSGLTNYRSLVAPTETVAGIHTTGLPTTAAAQNDLRGLVEWPGRRTVRFSFHDAAEGDESWVQRLGWAFEPWPMVPADDLPWSFFERPSPEMAFGARDRIIWYHAQGWTVVMGCVHNRERGQLEAALVGMKLLGWNEGQAKGYMDVNGSRWRLTPGLIDFYLSEMP